jgi:hypothetical protein
MSVFISINLYYFNSPLFNHLCHRDLPENPGLFLIVPPQRPKIGKIPGGLKDKTIYKDAMINRSQFLYKMIPLIDLFNFL